MKSICTVSLLGLLLSVNMNAQCWQQVAAGGEHTLAIKNNGTLWAWGSNSLGKLGIGMQRDQYTPVQVGSDSNWAQVTAGGGHSLAIKSDGTLWAWGSNYAGQLGIG
ncbi:MAG: chromosome condensation regulator RCC1, partial [Thermoanaerobaculia bacterium]|nr:chromosome condensation regulator RCC1 [Thermoanaerobaculia bacterium]